MSFIENSNKNPEFLNEFLKYNAFINMHSNYTVDELFLDIRTFFRFLKFNEQDYTEFNTNSFKNIDISTITLTDMNNITHKDIDNFLYFIRYSLDNSAKTRNRKVASLRKFFKYLDSNNLIQSNPMLNVVSVKTEKRIPKHLTLNESKKLLSNTLKKENKYKNRNYAILCMFINCCIRLNELVQINLTDLKLDEKTLKIHGKGNMDRIIYLDDAVIESLNIYLSERKQIYSKDRNALFLSNRSTRISRRTVQDIIKSELEEFNNDKNKFHTHSLRHTGATLLYNENDTDILIIKEILGHKSLASTEIYTHISSKKMKEYMENSTISSILERMEENNDGKR